MRQTSLGHNFILGFFLALVLCVTPTIVQAQCSAAPNYYCGSGYQCVNDTCVAVCGGATCNPGERCDTDRNECIVEDCNPGSGSVDLGGCLRLSDDSRVSERYSQPAFLVNLIVRNLFVAAGVILFMMIIVAGIKLISGGKKGVEEARTIISTALAGFIIMFAAYWIVQLIKFMTGADIVL